MQVQGLSLVTLSLLGCNLVDTTQHILLVRHYITFLQAKGMESAEGEKSLTTTHEPGIRKTNRRERDYVEIIWSAFCFPVH